MRDRVSLQESRWDAVVMLLVRRDRGLHGLHTERTGNSPHSTGEGSNHRQIAQRMSQTSCVTSIDHTHFKKLLKTFLFSVLHSHCGDVYLKKIINIYFYW